MAASMSVFQSPLTSGKGSNSPDDVFCFDFLSHIVSAKPFGLEMEMKRFDARQEPMHGFKKTARMCRFHGCMALLHLTEKL